MALKYLESGKIFRAASSFDMSSYTELTLTFTQPDGTVVTKTQTGGQVTLGTVPVTDPDLGDLLANQYVEYLIEPAFLAESGTTWKVYIIYTDTATTPDSSFIGDCATFTVEAICP